MVGPTPAFDVGYHERVATPHSRQSHNEQDWSNDSQATDLAPISWSMRNATKNPYILVAIVLMPSLGCRRHDAESQFILSVRRFG